VTADGSLDLSGGVTIDNGTLGNAGGTSHHMSPQQATRLTRPRSAAGSAPTILHQYQWHA